MTVVDVHAHYIAPFVLEEADGGDAVFGVRYEDGTLAHPQGFRYPVQDTFHDVDGKLAEMDELGIDVTVWSSAPPLFFYDEEPAAPRTRPSRRFPARPSRRASPPRRET